MTTLRLNLIRLLERAHQGGEVSVRELLVAAPDLRDLDPYERAGWQCLNRWVDDGDMRARDAAYAEMRRRQVEQALADLEAREGGYDITISAHEANRMMGFGCLTTLLFFGAVYYFFFAHNAPAAH